MIHKPQTLLDKLNPTTRIIFLIDGLGAVLTASLLVTVLARFEAVFGMDPKTLYWLAAVSLLYAVYSLSCYYFVGSNWRIFLTVTGVANLVYCLVTATISVLYYCRLTCWGLAYFGFEIIIIGLLAWIELRPVAVAN